MFADDTTNLLSNIDFSQLIIDFKNEVKLLIDWCNFNKMDINWSKTYAMIISPVGKFIAPSEINVNGFNVKCVNNF